MKMSPARAHFLQTTAERESSKLDRETLTGLEGYDLLLA